MTFEINIITGILICIGIYSLCCTTIYDVVANFKAEKELREIQSKLEEARLSLKHTDEKEAEDELNGTNTGDG